MIKLYDPNEKRKVELRVDICTCNKGVHLWIIDIDGNHIAPFASITENGLELHRIDPKHALFKLDVENYIRIKY